MRHEDKSGFDRIVSASKLVERYQAAIETLGRERVGQMIGAKMMAFMDRISAR